MEFVETNICGTWLIESKPTRDARGFFARTFCARELAARGMETNFVQHSMSYSARRGTLRGLHFQSAPHSETKIICCREGAIFDVVLDLRPNSPSYRCWSSFELTAENRRQLYVPAGLAHGFQTLSDDAEVYYLISAFHEPAAASGVRYNDPAFAIQWPLRPSAISDRDMTWPDFQATDSSRPWQSPSATPSQQTASAPERAP